MIAENTYQICLPPNVMESLVMYGEGMGITDLLRDQVIGDVLLHSTLPCNYRDIPGEF